MSLHDSLAGMRSIAQWFLWRLVWDSNQGKYVKTPCAISGSVFKIDASLPENWHSYEQVRNAAAALNAGGNQELRYALGFWLTRDSGYWFFDLDGVVDANGVLADNAQQMIAAFPGVLQEWSSSGKGLHLIGRGVVPPHSTRPPRALRALCNYEFYTNGRGIAFGLSGEAVGSADVAQDAMVQWLVENYFPPRAEVELTAGPRAEWRGPADDDLLIERMLNARQSAAAVFGGKASVGQLWRGEVELSSEHDMALASHLAFWTGCDAERMERLMWRSGLVREKWREHRTYLRDLTIHNAIAGCRDVYQEPERSTVAQQMMYGGEARVVKAGELLPGMGAAGAGGESHSNGVISEEAYARYEELMGLISGAGNLLELHNHVVPAIQESSLPGALQAPLAQALKKQFDLFQSPIAISVVRKLVSPAIIPGTAGGETPLWVQKHCYVKEGDYFFDMDTGAQMSVQGFTAEYARVMPMRPNGTRENPVEWALNRWGMRTVQRVGYRPDKEPYFAWDGLEYANLYNPSTVPTAAAGYTPEGIAGIEAFQSHLFNMCDQRPEVFHDLLYWLAHNVQFPGKKIRWSPILKGAPGDGKTIISNVMRSAMGYRNVGVTGNATLRNSGGFTDWAEGYAVNFIEEVMLTGKERHSVYNATKEFVTNDIISINAKGRRGYIIYNVTNHWANTNHNDGFPLERNDRRWLVVFTPWSDVTDMLRYCKMTLEEWETRTRAIDHAWKNCGGEFRAWFLSMQIPATFNPDGHARMTPEKLLMVSTSQDDAESIAAQIIEDGGVGITTSVFSSSALTNMLRFRSAQENFDLPKTSNLHHMLTRLGFSKFPKLVKWNGKPHHIWIKNGFKADNDSIRSQLDSSLPN